MQSESRDRVSSLPQASPQPAGAAAAGAGASLGGASGRFPPTAPVASGVPQAQFRPRAPSLIPNMDTATVEIVKQGWINKQGGAKGGRKSWYEHTHAGIQTEETASKWGELTDKVVSPSPVRVGNDAGSC